QTLADLVTLETASRAVQVRILSVFALIAFSLAAIGIHGLLSFAVSQRIPEFGVRRALGAQSRDIVALVLGRCVRVGLAGIIPGTALAYAAGRSLEALLAGIKPGDALTFTSALTVCAVMTALGSLAPTLRASRVDPVAALRTE